MSFPSDTSIHMLILGDITNPVSVISTIAMRYIARLSRVHSALMLLRQFEPHPGCVSLFGACQEQTRRAIITRAVETGFEGELSYVSLLMLIEPPCPDSELEQLEVIAAAEATGYTLGVAFDSRTAQRTQWEMVFKGAAEAGITPPPCIDRLDTLFTAEPNLDERANHLLQIAYQATQGIFSDPIAQETRRLVESCDYPGINRYIDEQARCGEAKIFFETLLGVPKDKLH